MTQFTPKTHPARDMLDAATGRWPGLWAACDDERKKSEHEEGIYLSTSQVEGCARSMARTPEWRDEALRISQMGFFDRMQLMNQMAALASWRMTQGIYRIDQTVYRALVDTPLAGDIPATVLRQMPEWCLYVETPDAPDGIPGFFARIDTLGPSDVLSLMTLSEKEEFPTYSVPLFGSIEGVIKMMGSFGASESSAAAMSDALSRSINLLLYICCQSHDIHGKRGQPGNPVPKRTRRDGWRLFPADGVRTWDVGVRMGAALRAAYHAQEAGQGGEHSGPRGHIRRAHWHGFRSGKRVNEDGTPIPAEKRPFHLKWLPPIAVNLDGVDEMPATIRRVP